MVDYSTYDPYIAKKSDVPVAGPDTYSGTQKNKALYMSEARLEGEVNDGAKIDPVTKLHTAAVANLATHYLTHAAEEPDDVTLGDVADTGQKITKYSSRYLDEYESMVDAIEDSQVEAGGIDHFSYTTGTK